jgi:hypothetical protein
MKGTKLQRQNQHRKRLMSKIKRWKVKEKDTTGLEKELGYSSGKLDRPTFRSGRDCDPRLKKWQGTTE